ncbi:pullulanase [Petrotoga sp. 8T1HF07.NaAc.6.1]|uniref:type I pullulanase n=1 Tax=Petrotoga sp. 8T1HF07.NaAc.6.1 TaxID=1351838 RepID=UPI00192C2B35|nr:type I pullulanase [Petrotoga sp. 8T1HF07.NaAc.6.1]MBL5981346.1 pullulanase [Petrotoga sp. 8T1HF07.NaAc.6.1]
MRKVGYFLLVFFLISLLLGCSAQADQATQTQALPEEVESTNPNNFVSLSEGKTAANFDAQTVLIVHYHRPDGDYEPWNLWIWPSKPVSKEGARYLFEGEDSFGKYAIVKFEEKHEELGFIVRTDSWEKDISMDRFVSIPESGVAEIWVLSGVENYYTDPKNLDLSPRVNAAIMDSFDEIKVSLTVPFDTKEWEGKVHFYQVDGSDPIAMDVSDVYKTDPTDISVTSNITIKLANPISSQDVDKLYKIDIEGYVSENYVIMRNILDDEVFHYYGNDLGAVYSPAKTDFKVWSPVSSEAKVLLFHDYLDEEPYKEIPMSKNDNGVWHATMNGDLKGQYYLYEFVSYGETRRTIDIYSTALAVNSAKSAIIDLNDTDPVGWNNDTRPVLKNPEDAIVYEIHVKDFTIDESSGVPEEYRGKYLGLTVDNTQSPTGVKTGLSHLKELGVTHVHIMPIQDAGSLDETKFDEQYGWGYDPLVYNVPEGIYSTDPYDPLKRINEVKTVVKTFHENGIRVVMDVVYNHTYQIGKNSPFDQTVPYFYYRTDQSGKYTNGSGVGNEVATERFMVRKYIVDSLKYWVDEYHVDGFRFDLLGLFDKETVKTISEELHALLPDVLLYGEPWTGGGQITFGKGDQKGLEVAVFNDDVRDAIRGRVFEPEVKGFGLGAAGQQTKIKRGVVGSIEYDSTIRSWAQDPQETMNYVSNHDNHTLWDKNALALGVKPWEEELDPQTLETLKASQKFSNAMILTMQGVPFLHGGVDFARTKNGNHNPYNVLEPNVYDWNRKSEFYDIFEYYQGMIELRKAHPAFRMTNSEDIIAHIEFFELPKEYRKTVAFIIKDNANNDPWKNIVAVYNAEPESSVQITLPEGEWNLVVNENTAGTETLDVVEGTIEVSPLSAYVLYQN